MTRNKSSLSLPAVVFLLILLLLFLFSVYFISKKPTPKPLTFEECTQVQGSVILESYPEKCMTPQGQSFTRQLSDQEKANLIPPPQIPENPAEPLLPVQSPQPSSSPLSDLNPNHYTCPESGYIDCMPKINSDYSNDPSCTPEYIDWVKANCDNFQGIAY